MGLRRILRRATQVFVKTNPIVVTVAATAVTAAAVYNYANRSNNNQRAQQATAQQHYQGQTAISEERRQEALRLRCRRIPDAPECSAAWNQKPVEPSVTEKPVGPSIEEKPVGPSIVDKPVGPSGDETKCEIPEGTKIAILETDKARDQFLRLQSGYFGADSRCASTELARQLRNKFGEVNFAQHRCRDNFYQEKKDLSETNNYFYTRLNILNREPACAGLVADVTGRPRPVKPVAIAEPIIEHSHSEITIPRNNGNDSGLRASQ